jgi:hypothetical protein
METLMRNTGITDEMDFLAQAFADGNRLTTMIAAANSG